MGMHGTMYHVSGINPEADLSNPCGLDPIIFRTQWQTLAWRDNSSSLQSWLLDFTPMKAQNPVSIWATDAIECEILNSNEGLS